MRSTISRDGSTIPDTPDPGAVQQFVRLWEDEAFVLARDGTFLTDSTDTFTNVGELRIVVGVVAAATHG